MEQFASDIVYKRHTKKGTTNTDKEVQKIGMRVDKMQKVIEIWEEEKRKALARKYFQIWTTWLLSGNIRKRSFQILRL